VLNNIKTNIELASSSPSLQDLAFAVYVFAITQSHYGANPFIAIRHM